MISVVILAGGKGERLFPLTNTRPKPLCPVFGVPPLIRAVNKAREINADEIIVTAYHMPELIEEAVADFADVRVVREDMPLGTAGAVKNAAPAGDIIVVLSGDAVFDFTLEKVVVNHRAHAPMATIVTTQVTQPTEYGVVLSADDRIHAFVEKPSWQRVLSDVVNTGIYLLSARVLDLIPPNKSVDFAKDLFPQILDDGIREWRCNGYWCDIGNPASFYACSMVLSDGESVVSNTARISQAATINEAVLMEGVVVGSGSMIDRAIICENVTIGENCFIPEGCVIGGDTVISDDVVFSKNIVVTNGAFIGKRGRIMKNIYFGETKKRLFDSQAGIGGVYGVTFDAADAMYLGQSLCQMEISGDMAKIGVMHCDDVKSRLIADGVGCGVRYGGGSLLELGGGFHALCGFAPREYGLDYAVFAAVSAQNTVSVSVFDCRGMPLSREGERRLENLFYRRTAPQAAPTLPRSAEFTDSARYVYANMLAAQAKDLSGMRLEISHEGEPNSLLTACVRKAGGEVREGLDSYCVSIDGSRLTATTAAGRELCGWQFLCCYFTHKAVDKVYLDELAPTAVSDYLASKGIKVTYYNDADTPERRAASSERCLFDGAVLCLKILNILKESGKSLDDLLSELPVFFVKTMDVEYDEEEKAAAAKQLAEQCQSHEHGMRFVYEDLGSVTIAPTNGAAFRLFAESVSAEIADELCEMTRKKLAQQTDSRD